jgi:hypothetical protein
LYCRAHELKICVDLTPRIAQADVYKGTKSTGFGRKPLDAPAQSQWWSPIQRPPHPHSIALPGKAKKEEPAEESCNSGGSSPIILDINDTLARVESEDIWNAMEPVYPFISTAPHASAQLVCMTPRVQAHGTRNSIHVRNNTGKGLEEQDFTNPQYTSRSTNGIDVLELYTTCRSAASNASSPDRREWNMMMDPPLTSRSRASNASGRKKMDFLDPFGGPPLTSRSTVSNISTGTQRTDMEPPYTARSVLSSASAQLVTMTPRVRGQSHRMQTQALEYRSRLWNSATAQTINSDVVEPLAASRSTQASSLLPPKVPSLAHKSGALQAASGHPQTLNRDTEASLMMQILNDSMQPCARDLDAQSVHSSVVPRQRIHKTRGQTKQTEHPMPGQAGTLLSDPLASPRLTLSLSQKIFNFESIISQSNRLGHRVFTPRVLPTEVTGRNNESEI